MSAQGKLPGSSTDMVLKHGSSTNGCTIEEGWQTFHGAMLNWFPTKRRLGKIERRVAQDDYMEFGAAYCLPGAEKKLEQQSKSATAHQAD